MTERTRQSGGITGIEDLPTRLETRGTETGDVRLEMGGRIFRGPNGTRLFQLVAVKHAILLEAKGLRHSKFRCGVRGLWAKHYGMPPRSKAIAVIARIQEEIDSLAPNPQEELPL